ncbi:MAG: hypothetical protein PF638_05570 [Candidatus Delongbacteria bacterium]|nr:hypothetical protein [Candidatus Delongbacteria bacterium]
MARDLKKRAEALIEKLNGNVEYETENERIVKQARGTMRKIRNLQKEFIAVNLAVVSSVVKNDKEIIELVKDSVSCAKTIEKVIFYKKKEEV